MTTSRPVLLALRRRHDQGETTDTLADEAGLDAPALRHQWRRIGEGFRHHPTDDEVRHAWDVLDFGGTLEAAAAAIDMRPRTVAKWFFRGDPPHPPEVRAAAVERCQRDGVAVTAAKTGLCPRVLREWCARACR